MSIKKNLPIGISSFNTLINENCLYIDKTENIHRLITTGKRYFLSRPRRFGKSLLVSMLKEIFSGNKELFNNLWIGQNDRYTWKKHPVVVIDLTGINSSSAEMLTQELCEELDRIGKKHGVKLFQSKTISSKIKCLISTLAENGKVAVLIDEYDAPITDAINNPELAEQNRTILRSFYSSFKALDEHLHFLFLTGVSKFSKTSVSSGLNNLKDLSLNPTSATLCGYTEDEIRANFKEYLEDFSTARNCSIESIIDEMRTWYNGYHFSRAETKVYNPFSVFHYLDEQHCANYWFATGSPKFLIELIRKNTYIFNQIDHSLIDSTLLDSFDIDAISLTPLLYQTGYLTIEEYV